MSKEMTPKEALQMIQDNLTPRVLGIFPVEFHIVKEALDRLEQLEKENEELTNTIAETHYKMVRYKKFIDFLKINFNIVLDSKLRISDDLECVQTFVYDLPKNTTIKDMFEIIEEVLENGGN